MKAVIMAGGMGTRLASITKNEIPKAMVPVKDKPLIRWQTDRLREYGIDEITIVIGNLGDKIREYFGDGSAFGIKVTYVEETQPLGTAGSFYYLNQLDLGEDFFLIFGDIFFDIDLERMIRFHEDRAADVTLLAHPNMHPYDSDLIRADKSGRVSGFDSKHNIRDYYYDNLVNAGIYILNRKVLTKVAEPKKLDFEHDILAAMVENGENVYAYRTPEFVRDVGTVDRITRTREDLDAGIIQGKNLRSKQKAIFMDRDGVINETVGFLYHPDMLKVYSQAAEAIRKINASGYLAIVATNQPVIARGDCSCETLQEIFMKLKTELGKEGAYLDDIFFCPHHPDAGYEGEVKELKIDCNCRKPKPGMALEAAEKYNIDLSQSWMIGDRTSDLKFGENAGMKTVKVLTGDACTDGRFDMEADLTAEDILDAVNQILLQP